MVLSGCGLQRKRCVWYVRILRFTRCTNLRLCASHTRQFGTRGHGFINLIIGVWHSLVVRLVRDQEAVGSNPVTPTKKTTRGLIPLVVFLVYATGKRAHTHKTARFYVKVRILASMYLLHQRGLAPPSLIKLYYLSFIASTGLRLAMLYTGKKLASNATPALITSINAN